MKQFLKYTLATIVGVIIAWFIGVLLFFGIVGALSKGDSAVTTLKPNSIYELELSGSLIDRSEDNPLMLMAQALGQDEEMVIGLDDVLANIKKAKDDENIAGIYLKGGELFGGMASLKEIRDALSDFKKSGKFIVAYADN
ncbi:MAG TPA: signal peptide peptidase SppA, partial [Paludibacter sp.]|nr:signal peptide peptidase SppA [Paludibacter sp.]